MYDFTVDSIQDMIEFFEWNRHMEGKKDRNVLYFAVCQWSLDGVWKSLEMIQNRPCWNWDAVRSHILTWFWFHSDEVYQIKQALSISVADQPIVVARIINIEGSRQQFERKLKW